LPTSTSQTPTNEPTDAAQPQQGFTGVHAENYVIAYQVCGAFSLRKLAQDFGSAADPRSVAEAYAEGYREGYKQANFEGCLDRLLKGPAAVRARKRKPHEA
jgi:hypothetical protein